MSLDEQYDWNQENGLICAFDLDRKGGGKPLSASDLLKPREQDSLRWIHLDFSKPAGKNWLMNHSGIETVVLEAMLEAWRASKHGDQDKVLAPWRETLLLAGCGFVPLGIVAIAWFARRLARDARSAGGPGPGLTPSSR